MVVDVRSGWCLVERLMFSEGVVDLSIILFTRPALPACITTPATAFFSPKERSVPTVYLPMQTAMGRCVQAATLRCYWRHRRYTTATQFSARKHHRITYAMSCWRAHSSTARLTTTACQHCARFYTAFMPVATTRMERKNAVSIR